MLAADIEWMLPQLRAEAEARMTATCRIGVFTVTTDPVTLEPVETFTDLAYTGKCRIRALSVADNTVEVGGQNVAVQTFTLSLPIVGSELVRTGLEVLIDANPHDTALAGRKFRVAGFNAQSDGTARRIPLEVVT